MPEPRDREMYEEATQEKTWPLDEPIVIHQEGSKGISFWIASSQFLHSPLRLPIARTKLEAGGKGGFAAVHRVQPLGTQDRWRIVEKDLKKQMEDIQGC